MNPPFGKHLYLSTGLLSNGANSSRDYYCSTTIVLCFTYAEYTTSSVERVITQTAVFYSTFVLYPMYAMQVVFIVYQYLGSLLTTDS